MMRVVKEKPKDRSPVTMMAENYLKDLDLLRGLSFLIITETDVRELKALALGYKIEDEVSKKTFVEIAGKLKFKIQDKLDFLVMEGLLETDRQKDAGKKPTKDKFESQAVPESIRDD